MVLPPLVVDDIHDQPNVLTQRPLFAVVGCSALILIDQEDNTSVHKEIAADITKLKALLNPHVGNVVVDVANTSSQYNLQKPQRRLTKAKALSVLVQTK